MPPSVPRLYVASISVAKASTPGLATGSQESCGTYGASASAVAGSLTAARGAGSADEAVASGVSARPPARR